MSMKIQEAMSIIEKSGLLLERIKKYRTTDDERKFRDNRSDYDHDSIKHKMWEIAREEGIEKYVDGIGIYGNIGSSERKIGIEFAKLGVFGKMLVQRLKKAVGADEGYNKETLYFDIEEIRKQSHWWRTFRTIFRDMLKDRFGVPDEAFTRQEFYDTPDQWMDNAEKNYDRIEEYIEDKQYGGIHDLNYRSYRQTIKDAMDAENSPDNVDKYVTNQYGFSKRIDEIYVKFRKFCRLFKREMERQRGNLTKPTEA